MRKLSAFLLTAAFALLAGCAVPASTVPETSSVPEISSASESAAEETVRVTIPEGFTVLQICARLEANGICSGQEFFEASQAYEPSSFTVPEDENRAYKMEGYLFPATYEFQTNSDPTDVLITMLNAYRANAGDLTTSSSLSPPSSSANRAVRKTPPSSPR